MAERYSKPVPAWQRREQLPDATPRAPSSGGKTPYRLGRDFERAIRGRLERRDYFVMRAALSKGKVDLLAVGAPCVALGISGLFIQCKRRGDIGSAEWNEVYELGTAHYGWPVLVKKESEKTVGFYRLDAPRAPRKPGRPWTQFDPRDLSLLLPPPTLL